MDEPDREDPRQWRGTVIWQKNYPCAAPGYRVAWRQGAKRLGRPLTFYLPAP